MSVRTTRRMLLGAGAIISLTLTGCAGSVGQSAGSNGGGEGIAPGATKEEYIAAFEDVEPIELDFQIASTTPKAYGAMRDIELAESVGEWSGGKVTVNVHYSGAIASPTEVPDALVDGRLDLAHYYTTYEPEHMPAFVDLTTSMAQVPSTPVLGEILMHAVIQEVAFNTPEIMSEFTDRGMHVINPANPNGNTSAICAGPRGTPADWQGSQIRGNAAAHQKQAQALGGAMVSVELAEGYEALQRGILDCSLQSPGTALAVGWVEVAPHVLFPQEQSFVPGPGSLVAGSAWEQLPLVAKQLIFDRMADYTSGELFNALQSIEDLSKAAGKNGGTARYLDEESEKALAETNKKLLQGVAKSNNLDGAALNDAVGDSIEKWTDIASELGYEDRGGFDDFSEWYEGSGDYDNREYLEKISNRIYEEIILPQRPS